jgi:hypothetical protein
LQAQLRAAGMEIENLVKITTIVREPADVAARRPCGSAGQTSAGEHADYRWSRQPGLEG